METLFGTEDMLVFDDVSDQINTVRPTFVERVMTRVNGHPDKPTQNKRGLRNLNSPFSIEQNEEAEPKRKRTRKSRRKILESEESFEYEGGEVEAIVS